jgi:hypothetical protein
MAEKPNQGVWESLKNSELVKVFTHGLLPVALIGLAAGLVI